MLGTFQAEFSVWRAPMSDTSARLALPYLAPSQAQKHVTHNEALALLDILVQLTVEETAATTPPGVPQEGQVWALGAAPIADWAGQPNTLATWVGGTWRFVAPAVGWTALDKSTSTLRIWTGTTWEAPALAEFSQLDGVGVNTGYDSANRLAVSSAATLLSHEGAGHQLKVNKAAAIDTASLLFQTNWSGRAEMGTTGNDDFAIKVSADGTAWTTALSLDGATGLATGGAVQATATDVTPGRLARADYTFGPGNLVGTVSQVAGVPTGGAIESGSNANGTYVRFADGTQICSATGVVATRINGQYCAKNWAYPIAFSAPPTGTQVMVDGDAWSDLPTAPSLGRGDMVPLRGNNTTTGMSAQVWATGSATFVVGDEIPLTTMAIGRWF